MLGSWMLLALIALAALCAFSLSMKWLITSADNTDPVLMSAVVFVLVGCAATAFGLATHADFTMLLAPTQLPLLVLDVVLYTLAPILYFRAMVVLPVSQIAILHASIGVFTLMGGALLGTEPLTDARVAGAALIMSAIALIQAPATTQRITRHTWMLLLACVLYAAAAMVDQRLVSVGGLSAAGMIAVAFLLPGVALLLYALAPVPTRWTTLLSVLRRRVIYANAITLTTAYLCIYSAYAAGGPASGVTLILAAEAVIVVLFAAILLREREQLSRKMLAGLVVAVGVSLVG